MSHAPVSVIVVSRGRPALLTRCLTGLSQLTHPHFEVIVVADPAGANAARKTGFPIKLAEFDEANISAARNLGLTLSAGDLVAFIDDDSVPEPSWLSLLTAPFVRDDVVAAGGFVRGRNGIGFQWKANRVDALGDPTALELSGNDPKLFFAKPGHGIKTEGTNSAFRRDVLTQMGGFDPGFRFYLDETDVNLRLSGQVTAIVPLAQVHHGYAASTRRGADRMPKTLFEVGASSALFLRKHAPGQDLKQSLSRLKARQRKRLLPHMIAGNCEPRDVRRLLISLENGWDEGLSRPIDPLPAITTTSPPFIPFPGSTADPVMLSGWLWRRRSLRAKARRLVAEGKQVTLFLFSPTTIYHRVRFDTDGFWEQRGGVFGRAERSDPVLRLIRFRMCVTEQWKRVAGLRHSVKTVAPRGDVTGVPK